ncbi:hypothetical protein G9P44_006213 [Scheffersomyces stipitis]|nr:hypothetical protein G9P44_006213 [Scheffersomyces stipitis]
MSENNPVKYLADSDTECQRCKAVPAVLITRKEAFCKNCFIRFIRGKQRKSMIDERYKVKYGAVQEKIGQQKVLLALSGGVSSLVLTDVVASLLQEQIESHKGRMGFELVLLNIDEFELESLNKRIEEILPILVERYAPVNIQYKVLSIESFLIDRAMIQKVLLNKDFTAIAQRLSDEQNKYTVADMLKLCPNKSSMEDLLTVIYEELILRTAFIENCETIIYGHSMTRIANEILALTVRGRGSSVYKAIADHTVQFMDKEFTILFPLRDVLFAEIIAYADLIELNKLEVKSTIVKSKITKNLTIRDLTTNYFSHLDATGYASTASTVVKTGEKLGAPQFKHSYGRCQICGVEIYQDPKEWLRRITVNDAAPIETEEEQEYVNLYKEALSSSETLDTENTHPVNICYGCIVTLSGAKQDTAFVWPLKDKDTNVTSHFADGHVYKFDEKHEDKKVLDEYILTDDEE